VFIIIDIVWHMKGVVEIMFWPLSGCQWLTSVIPAIQEAEISRIEVRSQSEQIVHKTLSRKNPSQKGWWSDSRCKP
jgi:hypothetical protein